MIFISSHIAISLLLSSAGIVGIPVAKLTHPLFVERQDYKDEVLWVSSPREFVELVLEYLRDV